MKVLLVVIDAATPRVVCPAIRTGDLPTLHKLADAGRMHEASVTIFPSITPAATTSIVTGAYPAEHGIAGASWFDDAREEVAYYGDDFWVIARQGFGAFVRDFLIRLNGDRLRAPTLFETVERAGRPAACINYLVYRGLETHRARVPWLLAMLPGVPLGETVEGPSSLWLGNFVQSRTRGGKVKGKAGLLHRFGMDDASSGKLLCDVMASGPLPDFSVAYFADNDYKSHEVGPYAALPVVARVDRMLGEAFEAAGGLDRVLSDTMVIVTSDHGHCEISSDPRRAVVGLDRLLSEFRQAALGRPWRPEDEIMICPNMRAAQIYLHRTSAGLLARVTADVLSDERVDQVIYRTELQHPGGEGYTVATRRGSLRFARANGSGEVVRDAFGARWTLDGDPAALDLDVAGGAADSIQYPNALERIAGSLDATPGGEIWITAVPGCEFEVPGGKAHVAGGSHGALHALDSLTPLIVAGPDGASPGSTLPRHVRSVDIAPLCLAALGIGSRYRVGEPRR